MPVQVALRNPDLARFSDPLSSRVPIPHLVAAPSSDQWDQTFIRFEGYEAATSFRGEGATRAYQLTARFVHSEHAEMAALDALLQSAHRAVDNRLVLRTNFFDLSSLAPYEVGVTGPPSRQHLGGRAWDVQFTFTTIHFSLGTPEPIPAGSLEPAPVSGGGYSGY